MPPFRARPFFRLALIGALVATFGLAGCGRKGPLDPPPGASLEGVPQANMPEIMGKPSATPIGSEGQDGDAGIGPDGRAQAPKGPQKRIPLDVLLN